MKTRRPILLAEDDVVDQETVRRALKEIKVTNRLEVTSNGEEALKYLRNEANERPCLILLDLKMPKMDGTEFLRAVKKDEKLRIFPVVVLTTSKEEQDKVESFRLGVAGYMLKAVDYKQIVEVVKTIDLYWTLSELPERRRFCHDPCKGKDPVTGRSD